MHALQPPFFVIDIKGLHFDLSPEQNQHTRTDDPRDQITNPAMKMYTHKAEKEAGKSSANNPKNDINQ